MARTVAPAPMGRYRSPLADLERMTGAVREFTSQMKGRSRLPLRGRPDMLAGKIRCPHERALEYLMALHQGGMGREVGERFATWIDAQVAAIWADDPTPIAERERLEQQAESASDLAQLTYHQRTSDRAARLRHIDALLAEITAERALLSAELAALAREQSR